MVTEWDKGFDLLVGADIEGVDTEPCLDSDLLDLLHGQGVNDPEALRARMRLSDRCRRLGDPDRRGK